MDIISIPVLKLAHADDLPLPETMTAGSAGADLYAAISSDTTIIPGGRALIVTGIKMEIPEGYEGQIRPRSGLALNYGVTVLNAPGTIDSDYRGEIAVLLINLGQDPFTIRRGERIAQLIISPVPRIRFEEATQLTDTCRSAGGFGHTGTSRNPNP